MSGGGRIVTPAKLLDRRAVGRDVLGLLILGEPQHIGEEAVLLLARRQRRAGRAQMGPLDGEAETSGLQAVLQVHAEEDVVRAGDNAQGQAVLCVGRFHPSLLFAPNPLLRSSADRRLCRAAIHDVGPCAQNSRQSSSTWRLYPRA